MRVAVIGAGVVGVTTAWELAADGHEVTVFERRGSVAAGGSFAGSGVVAPDHAAAWGASGAGGPGRRSIDAMGDLALGQRFDLRSLAWKWRLSRGRSGVSAAARASVLRLARASRERLHHLTRELGLDYESAEGCLLLLRTRRDLARAREALSMMAEWGSRFSLVDAARCREIEPGLNPETPLHAGVHLPDSEVGNCRQFANLLRAEAQRVGVRFFFHTQVCAVRPGAQPELDHVHAAPQPISAAPPASDGEGREGPPTQPLPAQLQTDRFDAVVVCAAQGAAGLLRPFGLKLRMAPVWVHSVTAPLRRHEAHPDVGPRSAVIDLHRHVTISRIGQRIRVAGSTEIGGSPERLDEKSLDALYRVLDDWYPGATQLAQVQRWKGPQPQLADGLPVIGASGFDGVCLNVGHGAGGWALACGSARLVADALAGRSPIIDAAALDASRLR